MAQRAPDDPAKDDQAFSVALDSMLARVARSARENDEATAHAAVPTLTPVAARAPAPVPPVPMAAKPAPQPPSPISSPPKPTPRPAPAVAEVEVRRPAHMTMRSGTAANEPAVPRSAPPIPHAARASAAPPPGAQPRQRSPMRWVPAGVGAVLLASAGWWLVADQRSGQSPPDDMLGALEAPSAGPAPVRASPSPPATPPEPQRSPPEPASAPAPPAILARFDIATDAEASTDARMATELTRAIAADGVALGTANPPGGGATALAIARYDALQAGGGRWQVVAPLHTEEVYVLVRADSPLRHLHQLRGRPINFGPADAPRARSGQALYRRLFGSAPPASAAMRLPRDAALAALLGGAGNRRGPLDAVLVIDAQPSAWLASLPPDISRQLRLLAFDAGHATGRRALQAYLPADVPALAGAGTTHTLGMVSFLVVADAAPPGLDRLARALCARLPALQRDGHPKWREVRPALQLPVGLPAAAEAQAGLRDCAGARPTVNPAANPSPGARS